MAHTKMAKPYPPPKLLKTEKTRRISSLLTTSAKKALANAVPSGKTIQSLLSSATSMHPEIFPDNVTAATSVSFPLKKTVDTGQSRRKAQSWGAKLITPLPLTVEYIDGDRLHIHDNTSQSQSTFSLRRHTFPPANESNSHLISAVELPCTDSQRSSETATVSDQDAASTDSTRSGLDSFLVPFAEVPVHVHGSRMIHRQDIGPMIDLHRLAWADDRLYKRLQESQIASAEVQTMMKMLCDRSTSILDNVLVARTSNSTNPADIVGWLSCSIVRYKTGNKQATMDNELRAMPWNLAAAVTLNKTHNAGSTTSLSGDADVLRERNYLIEVLSKGSRWSQKQEFRDQVRTSHA